VKGKTRGGPAAAGAADAPVQTPTCWSGVAFGLALAALAAYHQYKLPPALPVMLESYGYDRVLAGGFMSVFALAGLTFSLRVGRGLERHGLVPYLTLAFGAFLAGEALALAVPENGWLMLLARGLEGVGFTVCAIAGPLLANINASRAQLPLVIGMTASWIPVGQISATLFSLPVIDRGLWQPLWWIGIALTVALALWGWRLKVAGVARLETRSGDSAGRAASTTPAQRGALVVVGAVFGLWSGQYIAFMTWLPQYLVEVHGFSPGSAALAYLPPAAMVIVFNVVTGALLRAGVPLIPLFAGSIAIQVVIWLAVPALGGGALGALALIVYGVTSGVTPACLFAMPNAIMGANRAAGSFAVIMTGRNIGILIGPVLLAQAVVMAGDWRLSWPLFGAVTALAALGALDIGRRLRGIERDTASTR